MKRLGIFSVPGFCCVTPSANSTIWMIGVLIGLPMIRAEKFIFCPIFAIKVDGVIINAYDAKSDLSTIFIVMMLVSFFPSIVVITCVITLFHG